MDIKEYSYILAVVDAGSISHAAAKLYISQPSLSIYIKKLEERLGFKFFHKQNGKLHLTDLGAAYVEYARKIVSLDAALEQKLTDIRNLNSGKITVGITATRATILLPSMLPAFRRRYPGIDLHVIEATSRQLEQMCINRKIDVAVLNSPLGPMDLEYTPLQEEEIVLAMAKNNPAAATAVSRDGEQYAWIDMSTLSGQSFILLKQGQRMRQAADSFFLQAGFTPNITFETSNAITAHALTSVGMGLSIITDTFCKTIGNTNTLFFSVGDPPIKIQAIAAYPARDQLSAAANLFIAFLQEHLLSI